MIQAAMRRSWPLSSMAWPPVWQENRQQRFSISITVHRTPHLHRTRYSVRMFGSTSHDSYTELLLMLYEHAFIAVYCMPHMQHPLSAKKAASKGHAPVLHDQPSSAHASSSSRARARAVLCLPTHNARNAHTVAKHSTRIRTRRRVVCACVSALTLCGHLGIAHSARHPSEHCVTAVPLV